MQMQSKATEGSPYSNHTRYNKNAEQWWVGMNDETECAKECA